MAQSIKNLTIGSKVKDEIGNKFIVIAKNHHMDNSVLLWSEEKYDVSSISKNPFAPTCSYVNSDIRYDLENNYPKNNLGQLKKYVVNTNLTCVDILSNSQAQNENFVSKYFLLSFNELGGSYSVNSLSEGKIIPYFNVYNTRIKGEIYWTRTERTPLSYDSSATFLTIQSDGSLRSDLHISSTLNYAIYPAFNVSTDLLVSNGASNGYYTLIFNEPPVINNIGNIKGSYGSDTKISYTATDSDDIELNHYISFDNGSTWSKINPSKVGNAYTYNHVFNELKNYNCRIKVIDGAGNETVSNMFVIEVSSTAPTVNIVSVIDKVITFKVNCITEEISKVEILINGTVKKTYNSGFDFNLVYEINNTDLTTGDSVVQIKAYSTANLTSVKALEVNKKAYSLPPVDTKLVINGVEYIIKSSSLNGTNHTYTLDKKLVSNINKNDVIKVMQDNVKVKCSLSNISSTIFISLSLMFQLIYGFLPIITKSITVPEKKSFVICGTYAIFLAMSSCFIK